VQERIPHGDAAGPLAGFGAGPMAGGGAGMAAGAAAGGGGPSLPFRMKQVYIKGQAVEARVCWSEQYQQAKD